MKSLLPLLLTLLLTPLFTKVEAQSVPNGYDYDYTDTDGNIQNIQDYFDQEKSVFIFYFDNSPWTYLQYQNLDLTDFYNTYGQGGNNDVVVLCMAVYGFDTYASLSNLDSSAYLGAGYENVSYTEDNPIPMIIYPVANDSLEYLGLYGLNMLCYDNHQYQFGSGNADLYMQTLYEVCCTSLETYDPGISLPFNPTNCDPLQVVYSLTNGAPTAFDVTDIDVLINGNPIVNLL